MKPKKKYKESKIKAEETRRQQGQQQQRPNPTPNCSSSGNQSQEVSKQNDVESFRPDENKSYSIQTETTSETSSLNETNVTNKKYSKREVFSNWEHWKRYDELERSCEEQEEEENQGVNFRELLKVTIPAEGHFMFKSEKLEAPTSAGNLFALDLEALSQGLSTIPFYKQLELPTSYFSNEEIKSMDKIAATMNTVVTSCSFILEELKQGIQQNAKNVKEINSISTSQSKINLPTTSSDVQVPMQIPLSEPSQPASIQPLPIQFTSVTSPSTTHPPIVELPSIQSLSIQPPSVQSPLLDTTSIDSTVICSNPPFVQILAEPSKTQREKRTKKSELVNTVNAPDNIEDKSSVPCDQFVSAIPDIVDTNTQSLVASSPIPVVKPNDDLEAWLDSVLDD